MNVLLITQTLSAGGSERSVSKLSKLLAAHHNVFILIIDETKPIDFSFGGHLLFLKDFKTNRRFSFLDKVQAIKAIKKQKKIQVSISFLEGPNFANILSRVSDRVFVSVRGHKSSFYKKAGKKWFVEKLAIRLLYNFSDGVIGASRGIAEDLYQNLGVKKTKVKVIPNFYNAPDITAKSKESTGAYDKIFNDNPVLITTGRLSIPKGHGHLLNIYKKVKQLHPNLKLMIVGDGELYDEFVQAATKSNLKLFSWRKDSTPDASYDIFLPGFVSNPFAYISKATLFVFTSLWEGFPNALAEAIICGTPVVTSDCLSGPRELLFDNLSYTVKVQYPLQSEYGVLLPSFHLDDAHTEAIYSDWVTCLDAVLNACKAGELKIDSVNFSRKFSEDAISQLWLKLLQKNYKAAYKNTVAGSNVEL